VFNEQLLLRCCQHELYATIRLVHQNRTRPAQFSCRCCGQGSPEDVRRHLRSTNAVECHHQVVRRRTRVIRIFPHEASLLRLLTALAIEQNDRWRRARWLVAPTFIEEEPPMQRSA